MTGWLVAACLFGAAVLVGWPARSRRARRRLVIGAKPVDRPSRPWFRSYPQFPPRWTVLVAVALAVGAGALTGGPVAALVGGVYGGLAVRAVLRRRVARADSTERVRRLDGLGGLAADLRAGLPASTLRGPASEATGAAAPAAEARGAEPAAASVAGPTARIDALTRAAWRLAEQTGAPLAELIERIEADERALDRALAAAAAQAAGARATAWLLAGLPLGGIALGYGIGVDPLEVLLDTPIGAACAVGAIVLQLAGLAWADRLSSSPGRTS